MSREDAFNLVLTFAGMFLVWWATWLWSNDWKQKAKRLERQIDADYDYERNKIQRSKTFDSASDFFKSWRARENPTEVTSRMGDDTRMYNYGGAVYQDVTIARKLVDGEEQVTYTVKEKFYKPDIEAEAARAKFDDVIEKKMSERWKS